MCQVEWRGSRLGLHLVNGHGQSFFIYARPLIAMVKSSGKYKLVKRHNRNPERAVDYHGGEIWGQIEKYQDDQFRIELLFGVIGQEISNDDKTGELKNVVKLEEYLLPRGDFRTLYEALKLMYGKQTDFKDLVDEAESSVKN